MGGGGEVWVGVVGWVVVRWVGWLGVGREGGGG